MSDFALSLKATAEAGPEADPIAGLKRAQADFEAALMQVGERQREILQDTFIHVLGLLNDDEACGTFMSDGEFVQYAGDPPNEGDRANPWFHAVAFVYKATTRKSRQKASKHASALWLLSEEGIDPEQVAATIKKRHGIEKLAGEAAKRRARHVKPGAKDEGTEPDHGEHDDEGADQADSARTATEDSSKASISKTSSEPVAVHPVVPFNELEREPGADSSETSSSATLNQETVTVDTTMAASVPPGTPPATPSTPLAAATKEVKSPVTRLRVTIFDDAGKHPVSWALNAAQITALLTINPKGRHPAAYLQDLADALKPRPPAKSAYLKARVVPR